MLTLTKNIIKEIRSLEQRKNRRTLGCWLAEGNKMVGDLLAADTFRCLRLVATQQWYDDNPFYANKADECYLVTPSEMQRVSLLQSPQDVLSVFELPNIDSCQTDIDDQLTILLDEVQDPGNLGTIIRTADWFGIRHIFCAPGSADCFNPKVVQASMSALARVRISYFDSKDAECEWLSQRNCPIYGTFLEGADIYQTNLENRGVLVMGNEGRGISHEVSQLISNKLLIPDFNHDGQHVESLNVSIATAICLSEFRRR